MRDSEDYIHGLTVGLLCGRPRGGSAGSFMGGRGRVHSEDWEEDGKRGIIAPSWVALCAGRSGNGFRFCVDTHGGPVSILFLLYIVES